MWEENDSAVVTLAHRGSVTSQATHFCVIRIYIFRLSLTGYDPRTRNPSNDINTLYWLFDVLNVLQENQSGQGTNWSYKGSIGYWLHKWIIIGHRKTKHAKQSDSKLECFIKLSAQWYNPILPSGTIGEITSGAQPGALTNKWGSIVQCLTKQEYRNETGVSYQGKTPQTLPAVYVKTVL